MRKQKPMSFDELLKDLQGQKTIQEDPNHISLGMLFNEAFISRHSNSATFDELLEKGNFQAKTWEDIDNILEELLDRHIARETDFANWKAMLDTATREYNEKSCP